jgi:ribose transport system substrate-binding protein
MASTKVVYYLPDSANPFWREVVAGLEQKMAGFGVTVQTVSASHDEKLQCSQLTEYLQLRPDGVFISPVEMASVSPACRAISQAGIPVIGIDQTMTGSTNANVIAGNMKGGYLAAQHLAASLTAGKKVVHVQAEDLPNVALRRRSFEGEAERKGLQIIKTIQAESSRQKACEGMQRFLAEKRSFDGVFAENDAMALGVVDALDGAGYTPWPVIVGFDGVQEAIEAIRAGRMNATVAQNPGLLGERAAEIMMDVMAKKPVEITTSVLPMLITRRNV